MNYAIVDPLNDATSDALHPLDVKEDEFLLVAMTTHADQDWFVLEPKVCRVFTPLQALQIVGDERKKMLPVADGRFVIPTGNWPTYSAEKWVRDAIPESYTTNQTNHLRRRCGATDITAIMMHHCWGENRIVFESPEARIHYEFLWKRFVSQNIRSNLQAQFKLNKAIPSMPDDYQEHPELPLSDYQKVAMMMGLQQEGVALFMEQGTGKTPVAINRICLEARRIRRTEKRMMRVLIVCPGQVRLNWQNEFSRFATTPGKTMVVRGGKEKRIRLLTHAIKNDTHCAFTAVVMSYDTLCNDVDIIKSIPWDLCVCDESHYFKNSSTRRWSALRELREQCSKRMILTGTPIGNTLMDLYSQLEFLGERQSGFTSFNAFRTFHGQFERIAISGGGAIDKLIGYKNVPLLQERLARLTFSITKEEAALNLPDKVYDVWEVEMTPKQEKFYKELAEKLGIEIQAELDAATDANRELVITNILTKLLRLAQITSGFIKWDIAGNELKKIEQISETNPKVEAVLELLADKTPNQKTIIWATFIEDIRIVAETLAKNNIDAVTYFGGTTQNDREQAVQRFNNDPACRVFIGNPATAGAGLNLLGYNPQRTDQDTYCDHEIFFSQNWSFTERSQAEDRAHRRGTKMPVRITDLVVPGSIDQEIRKRVQKKGESANRIRDIKETLQNILLLE